MDLIEDDAVSSKVIDDYDEVLNTVVFDADDTENDESSNESHVSINNIFVIVAAIAFPWDYSGFGKMNQIMGNPN